MGATAKTSVLVAVPENGMMPPDDDIVFMPVENFLNNQTYALPQMSWLSARFTAYSPLNSKIALLGSYVSYTLGHWFYM
jgi:hypothetical protein